MNTTADSTEGAVFDNLRGVRDALSVRRVFGDPFVVDGVTIVPVARVSGGAGGGGGEGTGPDESGGRGFGTGFGLTARPVGVYRIENGEVSGTIETMRARREFGAGRAMKAEIYPNTMKTMSGPTAALMSSWRLSIDATPAYSDA